jgi:hypothetical protein
MYRAVLVLGSVSLVCVFSTGRLEAAENRAPETTQKIAIAPRTPASAKVPTLAPNARASDYLALGLSLYQANEKSDAAHAFQLALQTGNLNNQGRALAYWHLFLAHRDGNLQGPGAEALDAFITVSNDLIEESHCTGAEDCADVREFVDGFALTDRLLLAELVLDALWARRDPAFGRTPDRPVSVHDAESERLFVQLFKPCAQSAEPQVHFSAQSRQSHAHEAERVDQAQISCPDASAPVSFYFTTARN